METSLKNFREAYLETLLGFLWREWTALGVAGHGRVTLCHAIDPEALLLFTCSLGRYDQRLFDEVMDWLAQNGRFLNVQRLRNILRKEAFGGGEVLGAIADWLAQRESPMKWKLLAKQKMPKETLQPLFYFPDGRPFPQSTNNDAIFLKHGFARNLLEPRGYSQPFPANATSSLFLKMRALIGVNTRSDVLTYLALNSTGHPREVARELNYSQKAIHDVMTDLACSGLVLSSKGARERTFRLAPEGVTLVVGNSGELEWLNWPILLATAETVWRLTEGPHTSNLSPNVAQSEILLTMEPLLERLTRVRWAPVLTTVGRGDGIAQLQAFKTAFETMAS